MSAGFFVPLCVMVSGCGSGARPESAVLRKKDAPAAVNTSMRLAHQKKNAALHL